MSLQDRVQADLKAAMMNRDEVTKQTLRMLKAELVKTAIDAGGELSENDAVAVVKRAIKSRRESIEQYEQAGRTEAAAQERAEIVVLEAYLPQQLDTAELRNAAAAIVKELGLSSKKDMGRLMKELKARYEGQFDGKAASQIAGELLP